MDHKSLCMNVPRRKILVQTVQNHAARQIKGNFDCINSRGIDLVKNLKLYTLRERRGYFLLTLFFQAIYGIAPNYLSDRIDMHSDILGYDTREAGSMNVYLPTVHKEIYKKYFFLYLGGKLGWNDPPDFVKNATNIETFKRNYGIYKCKPKHVSLPVYNIIVLIQRIAG